MEVQQLCFGVALIWYFHYDIYRRIWGCFINSKDLNWIFRDSLTHEILGYVIVVWEPVERDLKYVSLVTTWLLTVRLLYRQGQQMTKWLAKGGGIVRGHQDFCQHFLSPCRGKSSSSYFFVCQQDARLSRIHLWRVPQESGSHIRAGIHSKWLEWKVIIVTC